MKHVISMVMLTFHQLFFVRLHILRSCELVPTLKCSRFRRSGRKWILENAMTETRGRPTLYTPEIVETILARLASGETLRAICRGDGMPARPTVLLWVVQDREGFSDRYASARETGYAEMADELVEIADDGSNDWMKSNRPNSPGYDLNGEHTSRSRMRLDTRKWLLSKALPKVYGERVAIDMSTKVDPSEMTIEQIRDELAAEQARNVVAGIADADGMQD
jgi:hypothetical protein